MLHSLSAVLSSVVWNTSGWKLKFKHARINAGGYSFNRSCRRRRRLSKHCVNTPFVPFQCLRRTKRSVQARGNWEYFVAWHSLRWRVVSTSPNIQDGGPPIAGSPRLLIQYIRSYCPCWRSFLHPQPLDAPCRGDRDPLILGMNIECPELYCNKWWLWGSS